MKMRRTRKRTAAPAEPPQIYLREAGRRRRPWRFLAFAGGVILIGAAALYALGVGAI